MQDEGIIYDGKKEKIKTSIAHEYSFGFNLMENIPYKLFQHHPDSHYPRLPSAQEQTQAMSTLSPSAMLQN